MKKQFFLFLLCSFLFISLQTGSASASVSLDESIEDLLGTPYKWGGTSKKGFDCSGFIITVFKHFNIELPRTSFSQSVEGEEISKEDLQPGDLVFFNTNGIRVSHAGIYIGDGKFAHSASSKGVGISKLNETYYSKRYVTARRVTSDEQYKHMVGTLSKETE